MLRKFVRYWSNTVGTCQNLSKAFENFRATGRYVVGRCVFEEADLSVIIIVIRLYMFNEILIIWPIDYVRIRKRRR